MKLDIVLECKTNQRKWRRKAISLLHKVAKGMLATLCSLLLAGTMIQSAFAVDLGNGSPSDDIIHASVDDDALTADKASIDLGESSNTESVENYAALENDEVQTASFEIGGEGDWDYECSLYLQGDLFTAATDKLDIAISLNENPIAMASVSLAPHWQASQEVVSEWESADDLKRYASDNFVVASTNEAVIGAEYVYSEEDGAHIQFTANSVGSAVVSISYVLGPFFAQRNITFSVIDNENKVTAISSSSSQIDLWAHEYEGKWGLEYTTYFYQNETISQQLVNSCATARVACDLEHADMNPTASVIDQLDISLIDGDSIDVDTPYQTFSTEYTMDYPTGRLRPYLVLNLIPVSQGESTLRVKLKNDGTKYVDIHIFVHTDIPELPDAALQLGNATNIDTLSYCQSTADGLEYTYDNASLRFKAYCEHMRQHFISELDASVESDYGCYRNIAVSDPSILKLYTEHSYGYHYLLGCRPGEAILSITDWSGEIHRCKISVVTSSWYGSVDDLTLNYEKLSVSLTETSLGLESCIESNGKPYRTSWRSSDSKVVNFASKQLNGLTYYEDYLQPVGEGTCLVWFVAGDKVAVCEVEVRAAEIASATKDSVFDAKVEVPYGDPEVIKEMKKLALSITPKGSDSPSGESKDQSTKLIGSYDIHFENEAGEVVDWSSDKGVTLRVRIPLTDEMKSAVSGGSDFRVYYVDDETGERELMKTWVEGDELCFETTHFSTYAIVADTNPVVDNRPQQGTMNGGSTNGWTNNRNPSFSNNDSYENNAGGYQDSYFANSPQMQQADFVTNEQTSNAAKQVVQSANNGDMSAETALVRTGDAMWSMLIAFVAVMVALAAFGFFGRNASVKTAASSGVRPSLSEREKRRVKELK